MRTSLTSGLAAIIAAAGITSPGYPGVLVELTAVGAQVLRYTSLDQNFTFNSLTWYVEDIADPTMVWDGTASRPVKLTFGDADGVFWLLARQLYLSGALVRLWQVYANVPNEAEPMFTGKIGRIVRDPQTGAVTADLASATASTSMPRTRIQQVVAEKFLLPSGTVLNVGGQQTILARPATSAA